MAAFLSIGFRPFYLGAAVFAALAVPLWVASYLAGVTLPGRPNPYLWHMHEMLFGFAPAVIAGFLLTAVRNWTGRPTPSGRGLAGLFGLWVAGRILAFVAPPPLAASVDLLFLPVLATSLAIPLWRARNRRNAFVLAILAALWLANAMFQAATLGWAGTRILDTSISVAADLILVLIAVIGGRVIPAFSANAIPGLQPRSWPLLSGIAIGLLILVTVIDLIGSRVPGLAGVYVGVLYLAAGAHLAQLTGWQPWRTRGNILLLALPLAYLWIPIHLALRAALGAAPGVLPPAAAHALFVGAMASMMLAMMTRSALGHTGRPLLAGMPEIVCFAAIHVAAVLRVFGPWAVSGHTPLILTLAGGFWTLAFAAFAVAYAPRLMAARRDA
jgi:uncharacterized protein involved in response to NO